MGKIRVTKIYPKFDSHRNVFHLKWQAIPTPQTTIFESDDIPNPSQFFPPTQPQLQKLPIPPGNNTPTYN